jgi:nucleoside-diphosphate-sugar epimerase
MTQVVVLGANGQVGAEVCLLLRNQPDLRVIPVCRNPGSSSFLRYHGMECRHGVPADPAQARELLEDADVVVNFAYVRGLPRVIRSVHEDLIENSFRCSPAGAVNIFISTLAVYGFPSAMGFRRKTAYGREKLHCEQIARREARRTGKPLTILRLGHVCGELQSISARIRSEVASGPLAMRGNGDYPSNTTYTATIVESIRGVIAGGVVPDTYDLVSPPQSSWRQVYAYEAAGLGTELQLVESAPPPRRRLLGRLRGWATGLARRSDLLRDFARSGLARLPEAFNLRLNARFNQARAKAEIAALLDARTTWVPLADPWEIRRTVPGLTDFAELRTRDDYRIANSPAGFDRRR